MRRKMLITIAIIFIMLLNCILPITQVRAASDVEITLNTELYNGVKLSLQRQGVTATYNDAARTLTINQDALDKITALILSNCAIDDLTGLESFTNLTSIDLSSNKLTKNSNLEVLNNFSLAFLDLSSNKIEDVSMITDISSIAKVNLHNQKFNIVEIVELDNSEKSNQMTLANYDLPQILTMSGYLESEWLIETRTAVPGYTAPYVKWAGFNGATINIVTGLKSGSTYTPYYGMVKLEVKITDSTNTMYNSDITLYYITIDSSSQRGIIFKDKALYKAVKEQLTKNQSINPDLTKYTDNSNLYDIAYDDPMVLVINIDDLINKITSLKLVSKGISDLTGIEWFIGLEKGLDVYDNKIKNIDKILELRQNKINEQAKLRERFSAQVSVLNITYTKMEESKKEMKAAEKEIETIKKELEELAAKYTAASATDRPAIQTQINQKNESLTAATFKYQEAQNKFNNLKTELEYKMSLLYKTYNKEYKITTVLTVDINKLTDKQYSDLTYDEAKTLFNSQATRFGTIESYLTPYEAGYIIDLYNIPTTTTVQVEKTITNPDGSTYKQTVTEIQEIEKPIGKYFSELSTSIAETASLSTYKSYINQFREIEVVLKMANYCALERLYKGTTTCYAEQYLDALILEKTEEEQSTTYLNYVKNNLTSIKSILSSYGYSCTGSVTFANSEEILYAIAGKLAKATGEEIEAYITIPQLKELNIGCNLIDSINGIEELVELKRLYAYKNEIYNITGINWSAMTELKELVLSYNELSDVKCLEVLTTLKYLDLSKNLISGAFNFNFLGMEKLEKLYFSYNRIDNISYLKTLLTYVARDKGYNSISDYMGSGNAIDLRFYGQVLSMSITVSQSTTPVYIDAPAIFAQLKEFDYSRTSFGIDSINGNVTNDGKQIILDTGVLGTTTGKVFVEAGTGGNGIGLGTTCTIYYTVKVAETNGNNSNNNNNNTNNNNTVSSDYTVKNGEYIVGISPKTTVSVFKTNLLAKVNADTVSVKSDNEVTEDGYVGTAMLAITYDSEGEVISIYELVVKGDINGDGLANATDSAVIKAYRAETTILAGAYFEAGDINQDGKINAIDSKLLLYHRAEIEGYIL